MNSNINIWSIVLILGIFQGLYIIPLLLRTKTQPSKWLVALVLIITLNLLNYLAINLSWYKIWPHFLYLPLPLLFLIGPTYYFYIRSSLDKLFRLSSKSIIHSLLFIAAIFYHSQYYFLPGSIKIVYLEDAVINGIDNVSVYFLVYVAAHVVQTLFYLIRSYILLKATNISSNEHNIRLKKWLQGFSLFFGFYWITTFVWMTYLTVANSFIVEVDFIFMLVTSLMINILAYAALYHNRDFSQYLLALFSEKYKRSSLAPERSIVLMKRLIELMDSEKPYLDPHLKISDLSKRLSISTNILSQVLNQEVKKNYFEFVNEYRIAEAIRRLSDPEFSHITVIGIAMDSGFNNKNTFNKLFKNKPE